MTVSFPKDATEAEMAAVSKAAGTQVRRRQVYLNFVKPSLDILFVLAASAFVLPLVAIMAAIVATDGSAPFYLQRRVGKDGRSFMMWKLRTMVPNAAQHLESYLAANPEARKEWDETQKLKNDPRVTRIGRLMRKTSLDELPQLWNVLKGDMSVIGPRPMMCSQKELYPGGAYYRLRPGITGAWQTADRNESAFEQRAEYDSIYEQTVSFKTDFIILLKTVWVVLRGTGY